MASTKSVNQSILFPTAKNVVIATKIDFLYCLACKILSKKLLDGVHFAIQDGGPKSFPIKCQHWFLVSGMSELSKNVYYLHFSMKYERKYIAILTICLKSQVVLLQTAFETIKLWPKLFQAFSVKFIFIFYTVIVASMHVACARPQLQYKIMRTRTLQMIS